MIAATLVRNNSIACRESSTRPTPSRRPTTARGGTSEIAIATPGNVSEMSERTRANAPTIPVARAAIRSTRRGLIRASICVLPANASAGRSISAKTVPIAITVIAPPITNARLRTRCGRSDNTTDKATPRIGVISGATIIAPMTVAVESATKPAAAMIPARISRTQKRDAGRPVTGPSM